VIVVPTTHEGEKVVDPAQGLQWQNSLVIVVLAVQTEGEKVVDPAQGLQWQNSRVIVVRSIVATWCDNAPRAAVGVARAKPLS